MSLLYALTLYVKTGCQYCAKVLAKLNDLGLLFEERNILDPVVADELASLGGKRQVPYLVDRKHTVSLYESDDIVAYLEKTYGTGSPTYRPRSIGVCEPL